MDSIYEEIRKGMRDIGKPAEYFVRTLLEGNAYLGKSEQRVLERELGREKCEKLWNMIWSEWAEEQGRRYREQFEKQGVPRDARLIGKIFRKWYEDNWLVTYEIVQDTPERHEGKITHCLDEKIGKTLFGETESQPLFDYDHVYAASQMEAKAICKAAGLEEEYDFEFDGFICSGRSCDRIVFQRKEIRRTSRE